MTIFGRNRQTREWIERASSKADDIAGRIEDVLIDTLNPKSITRIMNHAWASAIADELNDCDEEVYLQDIHHWLEIRYKDFIDPKYKIALGFVRSWPSLSE